MPRTLAWLTIGGSSLVLEDRRVGWNIKTGGWKGFVKKYVEPLLGFGGIVLHNPFGTMPGEPMQFDQYLHAAGHPWLREEFVDAWRPVTSRIEVIGYLGKLSQDIDFTQLKLYHRAAEWLSRFTESIQPILDAGMSIGWDGSSGIMEPSAEHRAMQLMDSFGIKSYVEARPQLACPHLWSRPVISTEQYWHRSDPRMYADAKLYAPTTNLKGEILRLLGSWTDVAELQKSTASIKAEGHSVCIVGPHQALAKGFQP